MLRHAALTEGCLKAPFMSQPSLFPVTVVTGISVCFYLLYPIELSEWHLELSLLYIALALPVHTLFQDYFLGLDILWLELNSFYI